MTYGLVLLSDYNEILISQNTEALQEQQRTVFANSNDLPPLAGYDDSLMATFFATRPWSPDGNIAGAHTVLNSEAFFGYSKGYVECTYHNVKHVSQTAGYGLHLYRADGSLIYDSGKRTMRNKGVYDTTGASTPYGNPIVINVPNGIRNGSKLFVSGGYSWRYSGSNSQQSEGGLSFPEYTWLPKITFNSETQITVWGQWNKPGSPAYHSENPGGSWVTQLYEV